MEIIGLFIVAFISEAIPKALGFSDDVALFWAILGAGSYILIILGA